MSPSHTPTHYSPATASSNFDLADHMPDVAAASTRTAPEVVIDKDDRVRITATEQPPWQTTASLGITARDGSQWIGTGWFISPRTLVTAGHCVYIRDTGIPERDGWVQSILVMPGRNEQHLPFGSKVAAQFFSVSEWTHSGSTSFDYGAIVLSEPFQAPIATRRFEVFDDQTLVARHASVAGYPGDKPPGTLWSHALPIKAVKPQQVLYEIDTAGGQSGAAVCVEEESQLIAVGVHAYGSSSANSATRITQAVSDNLKSWAV